MGNTGIKYTFFVLDFDGTFSVEAFSEEDLGVPPMVYLIPEGQLEEIQFCAKRAGVLFKYDHCIQNGIQMYFEIMLEEKKIPFQLVGTLKVPYGERQTDYLADYIPREIV